MDIDGRKVIEKLQNQNGMLDETQKKLDSDAPVQNLPEPADDAREVEDDLLNLLAEIIVEIIVNKGS